MDHLPILANSGAGNSACGTAAQRVWLGISQALVKAGEKDMMPLLTAVADSFQHIPWRRRVGHDAWPRL